MATAMALAACSCGKGDGATAKDALARDTALASDLKEVLDTASLSEAADVAMREIPDSTLPMPPAPRATANPAQQPTMRAPTAATTRASAPAPASTITPSRPRPTPIPVTPEPVRPSPAPARRAAEPSVVASASAGEYLTPACSSPASADQRRCLLAYLSRSDVILDRNYQARIAQLKRDAGTPPGAPEPESVQRLRTAQRAWLVYRDTECRNRNRGQEGALWAPVRAQCLAEFSAQRAAELQ
jgi:uncharacterized protein YecT (DUF1311 family)